MTNSYNPNEEIEEWGENSDDILDDFDEDETTINYDDIDDEIILD